MVEMNFLSFPELETERLQLKNMKEAHAEFVFELRSSPQVMLHIEKELMKSEEEGRELILKMQENYKAGTGINWAICLKGEQRPIGVIGLWRIIPEHYRAEIGYTLLEKHWNKGYISEALKKVTAFGFEHLNLHTIEANTGTGNKGSIRVLEKEGFVLEGHFKENYFFQGKFSDTLTFGKIRPVESDKENKGLSD